jgi:hypothetical protein
MKLELAAVAVSLLLVGTGAAMAMPGNAPADAPADDRSQADEMDENETESDDAESDEEAAENASERRGPPADVPAAADEENASQGPPADLPAQVPDFVSDVHDAIRNHEGGADADPLGDLVSSLTPGDGGEESSAPAGTPANGQ